MIEILYPRSKEVVADSHCVILLGAPAESARVEVSIELMARLVVNRPFHQHLL